MYRVSFTGYRPAKLGFFSEDDPMCVDLRERLAKKITELCEHGADEFYSGMALGVDTWCAQIVLELKKTRPQVRLTAVIPCRTQAERWSAAEKALYKDILSRCDKVMCISESYSKDCMLKRNRVLVDMCDVLLAVYDGKAGGTAYTVNYAQKKGRKVLLVPPM